MINSGKPRLLYFILFPAVIAAVDAWFQRQKNVLNKMFQLLTWSTVTVAFLRFTTAHGFSDLSGLSLPEIIFSRFFVHIVFLASALFISLLPYLIIKEI